MPHPLDKLFELYESEIDQKTRQSDAYFQNVPNNELDNLIKHVQSDSKPKKKTSQSKPPLKDPSPHQGIPPEEIQRHPVSQKKREIDLKVKAGQSKYDIADDEVEGDISTVDSRAQVAATIAGVNDRQQGGNVSLDPESDSIASQIQNKEDEITPDDLRTPEDKEVPDELERDGEENKNEITPDQENEIPKDDEISPEEQEPQTPEEEEQKYNEEIDSYYDELDRMEQESLEDLSKVKELNDKIREANEKRFGAIREQLKDIPSESTRKSFVHAIALARTYQGRMNAGKGKNNLGYIDTQNLAANRNRLTEGYSDGSPEAVKKFVDSVRSVEVPDKFIESSFEILPENLKQALKSKGKASTDPKLKNVHFLGYNEDGSVKRGQAQSLDRAKLIWKIYLQQGGVDAYTGLPLKLEEMDLEHVVGFKNKDKGNPTMEDYENREHENNMVLIASNVNQSKKDMNMEDFLRKHVDSRSEWQEEDFTTLKQTYDKHNRILSETEEFIKSISEGQKLSDDLSPELLRQYFEMDDSKIDNFKKETKGIKGFKTKDVKSEFGKDLIKSLGFTRGIPQGGRRTISFPDNVYRGFLLSMVKAGPEEREKYKKGWEEAIKIGGQTGSTKDFSLALKNMGLIDDEILNDKKMGRVFREDYDWENEYEDLLIEYEDNYLDDVFFIEKYGRAFK